jgi:hypothetical protein
LRKLHESKKSPTQIDSGAKTATQPLTQKIAEEALTSSDDRINRAKKSFKRGPKIDEKTQPSPILSNYSAERYRLYFELKDFEMSSKHRQIEERLENLITKQLEANRLLTAATENFHLSPEQTTLQHSTTFRGMLSGALVYASGVRKFDFLLLDWRPNMKRFVAVRRTEDTFYKRVEASIFYFYIF